MKILFIAPYIPSRIRVRPFQIIKGLAERHDVHVLALAGSDKSRVEGVDEIIAAAKSFRVISHSKLKGYLQSLVALPGPSPMCTAFCWSREMTMAVSDALKSDDFDVIHIEHLRAAHFAPRQGSPPIVFDSVDCLTGLFRQMANRRKNPLAKLLMAEEVFKLARYEPKILSRFDRTIATSSSECDGLRDMCPQANVTAVPNGVDTEYFAPFPGARNAAHIAFSGKMSYKPNAEAAIWFANEVFPEIVRLQPEAQFSIIGSDPTPEVVKLASVPGISVTGYVDDIRPYLGSATVSVVPMQIAAGIQNKILEALAMGVPVVSSSAASGTFGPSCPGLVVANGVQETLQAVHSLLQDPVAAAAMGELGREFVVKNYSWDSSVSAIESLYSEVLSTESPDQCAAFDRRSNESNS